MFFQVDEIEDVGALELLSDWAVDFESKRMKLKGGRQYKVYGMDALRIWIYKQIMTRKGVFGAYSKEFGSELSDLRGIAEPKLLYDELERVITECLMLSEYITGVGDFEFERRDGGVSVKFTVNSVYGASSEQIISQ